MVRKQMIVAICLMAGGLLAEARSSIHETIHNKANVTEAQNDVDLQARHPDTFLTTVREFLFIIITNEEIVAV
jgi:hypothetical protein